MAISRAPVRHHLRTSLRRARPAQRRAEVGAADPGQPVGVAGAGHQRGRAEQDVAVDRRREVHAEERQRRVGHGVDLAAHEVGAVGAELQVGAAERHDAHVDAGAGARGQQVRPGAAAGHRPRGGQALRTEHELHAVRPVDDGAHGRAGADLAAVGLDVARVCGRDRGEVDDPRLRASAARRGRSPRARSRAARPGRGGAGPGRRSRSRGARARRAAAGRRRAPRPRPSRTRSAAMSCGGAVLVQRGRRPRGTAAPSASRACSRCPGG